MTILSSAAKITIFAAQMVVVYYALYAAFDIRMHAIRTFGLVIHEFDPWFNFRATQYMVKLMLHCTEKIFNNEMQADHGMAKFFNWYDYMSWSPLGRPVGTTIYPGMQMVSVWIWQFLNAFWQPISLNDVCCYVPVGFGVLATALLGTFTYVTTRSVNAGVVAAGIMAIIPAHLMRSVGGGFDNESVAVSCLCLTFLAWTYSLSGKDSTKFTFTGTVLIFIILYTRQDYTSPPTPTPHPPHPHPRAPFNLHYPGIFTGLAYTCMVASWGGYIFVVNMIGLHAFCLILLGRFSNKLYSAYTLWYIIGTLGAMQVPVVGWTPLKSLEQLAPFGVFGLMQLLQLCQNNYFLKLFNMKRETMYSVGKPHQQHNSRGCKAAMTCLLPTLTT